MKELWLLAPAKVNLFLKVLGKREDGFHEIETLFQGINLYDEITMRISRSEELSVTMSCNDHSLPIDSRNLCVQGAYALMNASGKKASIDISLTKKIPVSAGLGGGSSDVASVLRGLMEALDIDKTIVQNIAAKIGSDVPFFLFKKPVAFGYGRGEQLKAYQGELSVLPRYFLLIFPHIPISAGWAYKALQLKKGELRKKEDFSENLFFQNDLQPPCLSKHPILEELRKELLFEGAEYAMLSGSGSTLFGTYRTQEKRNQAAKVFTERFPEFTVIPTESLH